MTFKQLITLRRIVISLLLMIALLFLWIAIQLEKELPNDGFVLTFDKVYTIEELQNAIVDPVSPSATTYDLKFGAFNISMVHGNLSYQMNVNDQINFSSEGQVVISRDEALRVFGMTECIGRSYNLLGRDWIVIGVIDTSSVTESLSRFQGLGKLINSIASVPKNIVLGRWGLGVNEMKNSDITLDSLKASELGSPKMLSAERQVNIWLSYEPSLLSHFPWQMAQWFHHEDRFESEQYMRGTYALNGIIVSDSSFHATLPNQYKFFSYGLASLAVLVLAIKNSRRLFVKHKE